MGWGEGGNLRTNSTGVNTQWDFEFAWDLSFLTQSKTRKHLTLPLPFCFPTTILGLLEIKYWQC